MDYLIDADEFLDEEIQKQLRKFRMMHSETFLWYRIQKGIEKARKFKMYHDKMDYYTMPNLFDDDGNAIDWFYFHDTEERQVNMIKRSLETARKHKYGRARVAPRTLERLLKDIECRRADRYLNPEKYMKKKILCIVGQSGAGKTLASLHLQNYKGANVICSYTTRPPRSTEVEGREHHFIDIVPDRTELLAYAHFGEYYYYATKEQVFGPCTVYVIDEKGLHNLKEDNGADYDIYSVYIKRRKNLRRRSGVTMSRIRRDEYRTPIPESEYDYVIENNSSKVHLFDEIERIYDEVCNKPSRI